MKKVYIVKDFIEHYEDSYCYDEFDILGVFDSKKKAIDCVVKELAGKISWYCGETEEYIHSNIDERIKRHLTIREFEVH